MVSMTGVKEVKSGDDMLPQISHIEEMGVDRWVEETGNNFREEVDR